MKYICSLALILLASYSSADEQATRLNLAKRVMEADGTYQHISLIKRRTMQDVAQQLEPVKAMGPYYKELDTQLDESLLATSFQESLANIYTEDELKYMLKDLNTPEGKSISAKRLKYSESAGVIIREWLKKAQEKSFAATLK